MTTKTINLTIPDDAWEETGWGDPAIDGRDRLLAQVVISGTPHHLEAYRAIEDDGGYVRLANDAMEDERMPVLQAVYDGGYSLTTIRGETYVVFMFPHAA
jgi:hypothetical protein